MSLDTKTARSGKTPHFCIVYKRLNILSVMVSTSLSIIATSLGIAKLMKSLTLSD